MRPRFFSGVPGLALTLLALGAATPGRAQLISPGKLSAPHAGMEGIRSCTQCHVLRKAGVSEPLCLGCHEALAARLAEGKGFHASVEGQACATCHKEHLGPDFALIRLDTLGFDHTRTGYALEGAHVGVSCRSCHTAGYVVDPAVRAFKGEHGALSRTFLGLSDACEACHEAEQPHEDQFEGTTCSSCHDTRRWEGAEPFDHARTDYPLTGEHASVACADCHVPVSPPGAPVTVVKYVGVSHGSCASCHEDAHEGAMPGRCDGCHTTAGWKSLDLRRLRSTFDHDATGFPLEGRHAAAPCASCHDAANAAPAPGVHLSFETANAAAAFPRPRADSCLACHEDEHEGAMSADCAACHTAASWSTVDADRLAAAFDHAATGYQLEGSHATADCASCHDAAAAAGLEGIAIRFVAGTESRAFPSPEGATAACTSCHEDGHGGEFMGMPGKGDCRGCHGQTGWAPTTFDAARHDRDTRFPLDGAHAAVACVDCHQRTGAQATFRIEDVTCAGCHASADPHGTQFAGRACEGCHRTASFRIPRFDHAATRFPLDGAHEKAACAACHATETDASGVARVRYRPLGNACRDCHEGGA